MGRTNCTCGIVFRWIFKKCNGRAWTGWEQVAAVVNTVMNFGFHEMRKIFRLAVELLASQERPCSMGLSNYYLHV
jgi:hypothetical protein